MNYAALLPVCHPTLYRIGQRPMETAPDAIATVRAAHERTMRGAMRAVLRASWRDRKDLTFALSALLETPRDSLARRLIDLAPPRERATLREQIL